MLRRALRSYGRKVAGAGDLGGTRLMGFAGGLEGIPREAADVVVIGAGVVGIAVAREFALKGRDVLVVEAASTFGTGTSSRNSEVIHAGIYYPPKSLKASLCVRGKELLYKYCFDRGIPHKQTGKLIVATSVAEVPKLEVIGGHFEDNCLHLHISESKDLENHTGDIPLLPQLIVIPKLVINSAGLSALPLAKRLHGLKQGVVPAAYYARGCYFALSKPKSLFSHLIYPIPEDGGLGVHVTLDLNGFVKFGPDVEWIDGINDLSSFFNRFDYSVNSDRSHRFYSEIRKYFPNLKDGSLEPGYSGIRPKLSGPRQPPCDFVIQGEDIHGVPGLINLFGIESPGLTSSLAIAEYIVVRCSR
ncbi:L-2-hydroxyglutarate dehydrogenase, mitochondrial [Cocos nucifera]|uniref:L-2-hydroxyglutarate dehydrogenase, mitochondrial n=1 Tax=Cocos nucifera TaxID=13894 RepID=A0A8K0IS57_COCNU|nr:L-2-hydroxyglutarate dehydrogenase, mitochondrial [Cocos nucifera]